VEAEEIYLEIIWKEVFATYPKILPLNLPVETEEN
jgi:hypothetical protein